MHINFIVPGSIDTLAGGYIYNKKIIAGLSEYGCNIVLHELSGDYPDPDNESVKEYSGMLSKLPERAMTVVDSLVAGVTNEMIKEKFSRLKVISLIHLPLGLTPWTGKGINNNFLNPEKITLQCSDAVIVTSALAKGLLLRYDIPDSRIHVIEPGNDVTPRKVSFPILPRRLLCVANIIYRKGYTCLLEALSHLKDLDWELTCCGSLEKERSYVQTVRNKIREFGFEDRVHLKGALAGEELEREFLNADLFISPSLFETCGMALMEAAGYGLPIVASATGIMETDRSEASLLFPPSDEERLRDNLYNVMTDSSAYAHMCKSAGKNYMKSCSWQKSAEKFLKVIHKVDSL